MSNQFEMDMDALGRLSPQVQGVADRLTKDHDGSDVLRGQTVPAGGETPSLLAARTMTTDVVPGIEKQAANRFIAVADLVTEAARRIKGLDDAGLRSLISATPSLLPQNPAGR
jgi:hypothetical protein